MGVSTGLISGILGGVIAGKQYKDRQDADKRWDERMDALMSRNGGSSPGQSDAQLTAALKNGPSAGAPVSNGPTADELNASAMANGGVVSPETPLPMYNDRMNWQRQSFKKNAPQDDFATVTVIQIK